MSVDIALLRAVNVGGRSLKMADWSRWPAISAWTSRARWLQSGNLVFEAKGRADADLERRLEAEPRARFGFAIDFIVRSAAEWRTADREEPVP